jgi:hypothetical protein
MASSREAFLKFSMWKNSKTLLRLTVYERGTEDHFTGSIYHVDELEFVVGFSDDLTHSHIPLDFRRASFEIERRRLVAVDERVGKVIFEETLVC